VLQQNDDEKSFSSRLENKSSSGRGTKIRSSLGKKRIGSAAAEVKKRQFLGKKGEAKRRPGKNSPVAWEAAFKRRDWQKKSVEKFGP